MADDVPGGYEQSGRELCARGAAGRSALRAAGIAVLALGAWLSAYAGGTLVNPQVPPPGQSDTFNEGYVDGCRSGFQDAGRDGYQTAGRRDEKRYATMPDYKSGYDRAYKACFEEQQRNPRMMGEPGGAGRS